MSLIKTVDAVIKAAARQEDAILNLNQALTESIRVDHLVSQLIMYEEEPTRKAVCRCLIKIGEPAVESLKTVINGAIFDDKVKRHAKKALDAIEKEI